MPIFNALLRYGNSFKSSLVAIVVPAQAQLQAWASANGVTGDWNAICANPKAAAHILQVRASSGQWVHACRSAPCSASGAWMRTCRGRHWVDGSGLAALWWLGGGTRARLLPLFAAL